jgi:hypothetical protein
VGQWDKVALPFLNLTGPLVLIAQWRTSYPPERAERAYCAILDNFPGDPAAKFMLKECAESRAADFPDTVSKRLSSR